MSQLRSIALQAQNIQIGAIGRTLSGAPAGTNIQMGNMTNASAQPTAYYKDPLGNSGAVSPGGNIQSQKFTTRTLAFLTGTGAITPATLQTVLSTAQQQGYFSLWNRAQSTGALTISTGSANSINPTAPTPNPPNAPTPNPPNAPTPNPPNAPTPNPPNAPTPNPPSPGNTNPPSSYCTAYESSVNSSGCSNCVSSCNICCEYQPSPGNTNPPTPNPPSPGNTNPPTPGNPTPPSPGNTNSPTPGNPTPGTPNPPNTATNNQGPATPLVYNSGYIVSQQSSAQQITVVTAGLTPAQGSHPAGAIHALQQTGPITSMVVQQGTLQFT